jgi:glycosyltransferase involved in cell wall biosynthesis
VHGQGGAGVGVNREPAALAIISGYPPPYGGVTVEVQRLRPLLERRGVDYIIYNAVSASQDGRRVVSVCRWRRLWTLRYLITGREPAVYLMSGRLVTWLLGAFAASWRGKRVLVQLRNSFLADWIARSPVRRMLAGFALRRLTHVVCVSRLLMSCAVSVGVDARRVHWAPAFLPPDLAPEDRSSVAAEVWAFVESHRPVIAANGKVLWYEGQDLYGLDHLVDLAARLKPDYPDIGIAVCFWDHVPADEPYLNELKRKAAALGVEGNLLFNTKKGSFVPVLEASNLFVRPTNTDGDAVSIREALYLGVPAVASDAVERPEGSILFRTRDADDFEVKVRAMLKSAPGRDRRVRGGLTAEDGARIEAYVSLLATVAGGGRSRPRAGQPS